MGPLPSLTLSTYQRSRDTRPTPVSRIGEKLAFVPLYKSLSRGSFAKKWDPYSHLLNAGILASKSMLGSTGAALGARMTQIVHHRIDLRAESPIPGKKLSNAEKRAAKRAIADIPMNIVMKNLDAFRKGAYIPGYDE
jgi:hypothetical protein